MKSLTVLENEVLVVDDIIKYKSLRGKDASFFLKKNEIIHKIIKVREKITKEHSKRRRIR
jgi:hypothetical protein